MQEPKLTKAVVSFLVNGDKVLLGLRKKVSLGLGHNLISGIGGKLEPGETNEDALVREVQEEIGVNVKHYEYMGRVRFLFPHKPEWSQNVAIYIVSKWEGEPEETEPIKPEWFSINDLPADRMWKDNAHWIPRVLAGERVDAVFLFGEDKAIVDYEVSPTTFN